MDFILPGYRNSFGFLFMLFLFGGCFEKNSFGMLKCEKLDLPVKMSCIEGGPFLRGSERESFDEDSRQKIRDESPVATILLSTFFLDQYEVTASEYQKCVKAGGCKPAKTNYRGYSKPGQPKLGVSWYDAQDYCLWRGKTLPTEAQWEKAARGSEGDMYPWGNSSATCTNSIIQENSKKGCGTGKTWNTGSRPAFRFGLYDMAGNSWEWVADWYSSSYGDCGLNCSGKDPLGPCAGMEQCSSTPYKVVRGGSWWWPAEYAVSSNRRPHYPANRPYHHFGFRCAMNIEKREP